MRVWKKRCAALLAAALTLTLLTVPAGAADTAEAAYQAYYDFLRTEMDSIGQPVADQTDIPSSSPGTPASAWTNRTITFAHLLDFNNDGIPELLYGKQIAPTNHEVTNLYTYANGRMVKLTGSFGIEIDFFAQNGYTYSLHTCRDGSGVTYVTTKTDFPTYDAIYCTVSNGAWTRAEGMRTWFANDIYINKYVHSSTGKFHYYLCAEPYYPAVVYSDGTLYNGREVSEAEYMNRRRFLSAGGEETLTLRADSLEATLAQIQRKIPTTVHQYENPSDWAAAQVNAAIAGGMVPEVLQKKYNRPITRAEFCTLAVNFYERASGKAITQTASFSDTSDPAVQKMAGLGVVTGIGEGKFNPNGLLTREAAAAILVRLSTALGNAPAKSAPAFADSGSISSWAVEPVGQCQAAGIMGSTGSNRFDPQGTYTREQSMVTLMRMGDTSAQTAVTALSMDGTLEIPKTLTKTLPVSSSPVNVPNYTLTWTSSNPAVATVDSNGMVTGVSVGSAVITATAASGVSARCQVTVLGEGASFFRADPTTIRCAWGPGMSVAEFDTPIANPEHIASIAITGVEDQGDDAPDSPFFRHSRTVVLHCRLEDKTDRVYSWSDSYFKWTVEDAAGKVVDQGVREFGPYPYEVGETFDINIIVNQVVPGESYTLRFYSYLP